MATLPCNGTYDGYEDYEDDYDSWSDDQERLERERQLDERADQLYEEWQCGDITRGQARDAFNKAARG